VVVEPVEITFFESSAELREWLERNHDTAQELRVGFHKKKSGMVGITYREAVDQALCFGWIDGVGKSIDANAYSARFTPRKPKSIWSAVNIARAQELLASGLMTPSGIEAFDSRDENRARQYSHEQATVELDPVCEEKFRASKQAWEFFEAQPPGYRRKMMWWVMNTKKEETRLKRLASLIEASEGGLRADPFGAERRRQNHG
jgi:uncharacterized protein YdeI (YjbR/CyaY-like superfamily)